MDRKKLGLWAPIFVLAAALVMLAVSTGDVDAARGGKPGGGHGGGKPSGGAPTATLTVAPNPVPVGSTSMVVTGSGFGANQELGTQVFGVCCFVSVWTDSTGAFSYTYQSSFLFGSPGSYRFDVWSGGTVIKSAPFTVQ